MVEKSAQDLFEEFAKEEPIRNDEIVPNGFDGGDDKSLDDYSKENPHMTDYQALVDRISPDFQNPILNRMKYARLSPDNFKPFLKIISNSRIKAYKGRYPINIPEIYADTYTLLTLCLDGKHNIDLLEAFGSKGDSEMENVSKALGFNQ